MPNPGSSVKVSPVPRVMLYPFGWSTWISLRLIGAHTVSELATFLQRLFTDDVFRFENGSSAALSLPKLFSDVARGMRIDAFGGTQTRDVDPQEVVVVATIMAKHGGSPALGALSTADRKALLRIVRPYGPPPSASLSHSVYRLQPDSDFEYIVHDKHGRFLWIEHLLEPVKKKYVHLRCYHTNSFTSLVHAWQLHGLLEAAGKQRPLSHAVYGMAQRAVAALESPRYRCASLMQYLQEPAVKSVVPKAAALPAPGPASPPPVAAP